MRLVNLFLQKKEHEIKEGVSASAVLRKELELLHQEQETLKQTYLSCRAASASNVHEAQMQSRYLNTLLGRTDALQKQIDTIASDLQAVLEELKTHHGEKKALETYQKRKRHELDAIRERKENETAYESFTHRMHLGR